MLAVLVWLALGSLAIGAEREDAPPKEKPEKANETVGCTPAAGERDETSSAKQCAKTSNGTTSNKATERPPPSKRPRGPLPQFRGPDITLIAGEERNVYEYRQNGQLRMIKVVPKVGKPYYLTPRDPTHGFGDLEQADMLLAEWVLWEF